MTIVITDVAGTVKDKIDDNEDLAGLGVVVIENKSSDGQEDLKSNPMADVHKLILTKNLTNLLAALLDFANREDQDIRIINL